MNLNEKRYGDLSDAVAFEIAFEPMIYTYDDVSWYDFYKETCTNCKYPEQTTDYLAPKSSTVKKDYAMLDFGYYGVSIKVHNLLVKNFDITDDDFRPIRNKSGEITFYQITPTHIMLPIRSVNRMKGLKCKKCGNILNRRRTCKTVNGYEYVFLTQEALDDLHDLNESFEKYECYEPEYIVSRRVYDFLVERYPRMTFRPIYLKSESPS